MKAIGLIPGTTDVSVVDVEEPQVKSDFELKLKVLQVGVCGTDREEAAGGRADAPPGEQRLTLGHEMFGRVVEVGQGVKHAKVGDYGLFTVRRGCNKCSACKNNRSDMCITGDYTERGIKAYDGFQAEYVVDEEQYFVKVPDAVRDIGVLTEPMSIAAKAIDEAVIIQKARLKDFEDTSSWMKGKKALVGGIGAVGLLAAFALRLRGAEVYGLDIVDEDTLRPQILKEIGGKYIDGRKVRTVDLDDEIGEVDFIFEAAGFASLQIELIDALGINGIYVSTGIPAGDRPITLNGAELMRQLVLKNQIILGSVNASPEHFKMAVADLEGAKKQFPGSIEKLITEKIPASQFKTALIASAEEIKVVVEWE